ncbi:dipeptidase [Bacillus horti]|uniref:Membrane dipeptidase n=1 Tax=Caldalkalibacillus horti TaxID=77523 RepID=A0ABT9VUY7_9BACI|nr:dipeptidase [Bacillus horti]MDQ0164802.1 membrane dipeptidase [Bacillus horti]
MDIFDGHCDVLYKMWKLRDRKLFYQNGDSLQASFARLKEGGVKVQTMAVYVPPDVPKEQRHYIALEMIDILHTEVLSSTHKVELLTSASQLDFINENDDTLYILLSLEGADALQGDLMYLRTYYQLGLRSVGLTWNFRNEAADGVLERNPAGLSTFGLELLREMNEFKISIDISHLSEQGFWDCIEYSKQPLSASHCNARALFNHPRNLYDKQIEAMFAQKGLIGINFVPQFYNETGTDVSVKDVLKQVDYMLTLGGEDYIGFGSDFDGISKTIHGLENASKMADFANILLQHYSASIVQKLLMDNWKNYYKRLWNEV